MSRAMHRFRSRIVSPRALDVASVALVLVAVGARLLPTTPPIADPSAAERARAAWSREPLDVAAAGGALDRTDGARMTSRDSLAFAGIVRGNLFSATRRAPSSRFVSPLAGEPLSATTSASDVATMPEGATMPGGVESDAAGDGGVPRLYGIVSIDGERRALLALLADRPPRLLRVGDREGRFRLLAIDADRVRIQTPGGVRTLRLQRTVPTDAAGDTLIPHP